MHHDTMWDKLLIFTVRNLVFGKYKLGIIGDKHLPAIFVPIAQFFLEVFGWDLSSKWSLKRWRRLLVWWLLESILVLMRKMTCIGLNRSHFLQLQRLVHFVRHTQIHISCLLDQIPKQDFLPNCFESIVDASALTCAVWINFFDLVDQNYQH